MTNHLANQEELVTRLRKGDLKLIAAIKRAYPSVSPAVNRLAEHVYKLHPNPILPP